MAEPNMIYKISVLLLLSKGSPSCESFPVSQQYPVLPDR